MVASRYEGRCQFCGAEARARDRREWAELLRLPCRCGQRNCLATTEPVRALSVCLLFEALCAGPSLLS